MKASDRRRGIIPRCRYEQGALVTERLRLVPLERLPATADLSRGASLASSLDATVPSDWPPQSLHGHWRRYRQLREEGHKGAGYLIWCLILRGERGRSSELVGFCGFRDFPDSAGTVELRYEVLPAFQRRGLATEGAEALVAWVFESRWARTIRAQTAHEEIGAMQVLAKLGFTLIGMAEGGRGYLFELDDGGQTPSDDD